MKTLFIGGIANGQIIDVPDKHIVLGKTWRVMEPIGLIKRILFLIGHYRGCPYTRDYQCEIVYAYDSRFYVFVDRGFFKTEADIQKSIAQICIQHVMCEIGCKKGGEG